MNENANYQPKEYYGEYKRSFFGSTEQIFIYISLLNISGRGYVLDPQVNKYIITEFNYNMDDIIDIGNGTFDNEHCSVLRTTQGLDDVYLPGLTVMTATLKTNLQNYKDRAMQIQAEKFKAEAEACQKSSANLSLEEEIAEFKDKVNKLKIMKDNGVLSPTEFQSLKLKLVNIYG